MPYDIMRYELWYYLNRDSYKLQIVEVNQYILLFLLWILYTYAVK